MLMTPAFINMLNKTIGHKSEYFHFIGKSYLFYETTGGCSDGNRRGGVDFFTVCKHECINISDPLTDLLL